MATADTVARPTSSLPVVEYTDMPGEDAFNNDDDDRDDEDEDDDDDPLLQVASADAVVQQPNRRLVLPEIPTFLYFVALVTQYPVQQFWLVDHFSRQCSLNASSSDYCTATNASTNSTPDVENEVQSMTNMYVMYISFVCSFTAIFPTLFLGPLTDKFGRKFVFYISFVALLVSELLTLMVFQFDLSPNMLLVSSFALGLSGSYGLYLAAVFGMVADISTAGKQRTFRVATLEASIAVGASLGVTMSGIWVQYMGYVWPMAFSLGLILVALIFFLFFIPETYVERRHQPFSCKTLVKCMKFFVKDTPNGRRLRLVLSLFTFLIYVGIQNGEANFGALYLLHQPFCWPKEYITVLNGTNTLLKWIIVMGMVSLCKLYISEPAFTLLGTLSAAACYLLKGLAPSNLLIFVGAGAGLFSEFVSPMCRTMMSKEVSQNEQGALFSGIGVLQMVVSAVAGVSMSFIYNAGLGVFLGLPYVVLATLSFISATLIIGLIIHVKRHPEQAEADFEEERIIN